jgi:hypothetical protein
LSIQPQTVRSQTPSMAATSETRYVSRAGADGTSTPSFAGFRPGIVIRFLGMRRVSLRIGSSWVFPDFA